MASAPSPASRAPRLDASAVPSPPARVLSNGVYRLLITPAGTGGSVAHGVALTRWDGDAVEDPHGFFLWVRDRESGAWWPIADRDRGPSTERCEAAWRPGTFRIERDEDRIRARLDVCVARGANAELRRVRLVNAGPRTRSLDVTTFAEIVLADPAAHRAHPGFSKLFLETELEESAHAILVRRRPRARGERHPWLVHAAPGATRVEVETDRARFLGRGRRPGEARALASTEPLSGTTGPVLDAAACLRVAAELPPGGSLEVTFVLGLAEERDAAVALAERFRDPGEVARAFETAERAERALLATAGLSETQGEYFQALAGAMLYGDPRLRAGRTAGDVPPRDDFTRRLGPGHLISVVSADAVARSLLDDLLRAHLYWRALELPSLLFIVTSDDEAIAREPRTVACGVLDERRSPPGEIAGLRAIARLVIDDALPDLDRAAAALSPAAPIAAPATVSGNGDEPAPAEADGGENLRHFNGHGGFSPDGDEYVVRIPASADGGRRLPPNPWVNVIANEDFGCIVSETGAGTTWSGNSRERRLTPWANDPVLDPHSEAFWIRDEETGQAWSPMPGPTPGPGGYETRHGFGASVFRTAAHGIASECTVFVPCRDRVRITTVRIRNDGDRPRRLSGWSYARLVLGADAENGSRLVATEADASSGLVLARTEPGGAFGDSIVFAAAAGGREGSLRFTADRLAFLGARGTLADPAALRSGADLDGRTGSGFDPCVAQRVLVDLAPGETREIRFLLGEAADRDDAVACVARYRDEAASASALAEVRAFWNGIRSALRISTPAPELDVLVNGWLPYQVLSCRIRGRSAFYQSGGAFGFRDQLQDSAALLWSAPERMRAQILLHARHQFVEGDVLHWWHPPDSRGIRTRFADDLVWLPWLTAHYVRTTGDDAVLREDVPFLVARALDPGEAETFLAPRVSGESADLYEHCCRALDRAMTEGPHGLPLFGAGDWNDGMNRVGAGGRGESVWMAMFLHAALGDFLPLCEARGDDPRAERYRAYRERVRQAANDAGWDGEWYRRGFYDDGEPLGSAASDECRIDALVQAWSVLSGVAPDDRAALAMDRAEAHLVSEAEGLIRLLTPAFDRTRNDPGYIRGYVPGVRENGGQYTHAAMWFIAATAELGRRDRVAALLDLVNPVRHARDRASADGYRVEPYVVAADVYGEPPHVGRGGWTWYTGAAGWMFRVAIEWLLGLRVKDGRTLELRPCVPDDWPGFSVDWRRPGDGTRYEIRVTNPQGTAAAVTAATLDGMPVPVAEGTVKIELASDGGTHRLDVELGAEAEVTP